LSVDFKGRTAIVTGAGRGLGREHALELARRGARVVVNDLGAGSDAGLDAANEVVEDIRRLGGQAIADGGSVTDAEAMRALARHALEAFGSIDILVANAGILRDKSFAKMPIEDFDLVVQTHVLGTARSVKAVWDTMREAGYGRIVLTTSAAGLMGNFGQANYAAAKAGIVGLAGSLRIEGERSNIRVNVISPFAVTRMSEGLVPAEVAEQMSPRYVAPAVAFLASEDAPSGIILNAGKGKFSVSRLVTSPGITLDLAAVSAEAIRDNWQRIADPAGETYYPSAHSFSRSAIMGQPERSHAG